MKLEPTEEQLEEIETAINVSRTRACEAWATIAPMVLEAAAKETEDCYLCSDNCRRDNSMAIRALK